jgi:hypothetical protein
MMQLTMINVVDTNKNREESERDDRRVRIVD